MYNDITNSIIYERYIQNIYPSVIINENKSQLKQLLQSNRIGNNEYEMILQSDNTPTKKYVGWIGRQYLNIKQGNAQFNWDQLRNAATEFITLVNSNSISGNDSNIEKYGSYEDLQQIVNKANERGPSKSLAVSEVVVYLDNSDALVVAPLNHAASRKLGLSEFAHRTQPDGTKDCAWCVTFKNDAHWNDYFNCLLLTFYFVKPKTEKKLKELKKALPQYDVQSIAVLVEIAPGTDPKSDNPKGIIKESYDANDKVMSQADTKKYLKILGVKV